MENLKPGAKSANTRVMKIGMWVCGGAMLVPVAGFVVADGSAGGLRQNLGAFAPLALCLGMHVAMHRFMGKSCHGTHAKVAARQTATPADAPGPRAGATE